MCSIISKGDKILRRIDELSEDLEDRIKDVEFRNEERIKELQLKAEKAEAINAIEIKSINERLDSNKIYMEGLERKVDDLIEKQSVLVETVLEKINEIDIGRKNTLIFNGIPNDTNETSDKLLAKVKDIIKNQLNIQRPMFLAHVSRVMSGPDVMGCRPVMVSFETFKDREEVLGCVRALGSKISTSVTEEFRQGGINKSISMNTSGKILYLLRGL